MTVRDRLLLFQLAIHMQREANNGWKIDRQKELMPLMGIANGRWTEGAFLHFLSEELSVDESEILSYDLNLYNYDQPQLCGVKEEILCSPRIDNLASVSALLESITDGERESGINLIGLFNHEEVGSFTKSGADSTLLESILNRILSGMGCSKRTDRDFPCTKLLSFCGRRACSTSKLYGSL